MAEDIFKNKLILVVDDEERMSRFIRLNLEHDGFQVIEANRGMQAIQLIRDQMPDLVLLDIMMPDLDGFEVLQLIRETSQVPVIMLTAKGEEDDKVRGLELGADDYVTKPYSARELVARINAVLRRNISDGISADPGVMTVNGIRMDIDRHQVSVNGIPVSLPLKEFELLEFLMRNAGRVLTRIQLIDRVWGSDYVGDTKTLDVHIKRIRAKIETDPANPKIIQTVRGLGYKMEL